MNNEECKRLIQKLRIIANTHWTIAQNEDDIEKYHFELHRVGPLYESILIDAADALEHFVDCNRKKDEMEFIGIDLSYPDPEVCTYKEYKGKPYFGIKYKINGNVYVGFGTYKPEILSVYIRNYFIKPKGDYDNGPE